MRSVCRVVGAVALIVSTASVARGQQPAAQTSDAHAQAPTANDQKAQDQKAKDQKATGEKAADQKPAPSDQKPDTAQKYEETVVVSASKTEEKLVNAPATMTVITSDQIAAAPSPNFADLMRSVPGVNITQVGARDINVTTRAATGTLATGQLALLDGRSLYQDFFGFVMWDFLPVNLDEIKQIEVIRSPTSAVWGANALNGVVNVITKSPREMPGSTFTFGVGGFDRSGGATNPGAGTLFYISGSHAEVVNDRVSFKLSAGGYTQDPYARPTGMIPCDRADVCSAVRTSYPPYVNQGTTQPKFDGRLDYDFPDGRKLSFSGGVAGTDGIMQTGIGPFNIDSGSVMGYARVNYTDNGLNVAAFTNILNGDATNVLSVDASTGKPVFFNFATKTLDVEASNVHTFDNRHVVSYGGNLRYNTFDLSLAPNAANRTEGGGYVQDEIFLSKTYRLVAGGRVDRFDYLDNFVFSPRVTFMIKPQQNQTIRLSYNRAYRSPSVINNFLDVTLVEPVPLGLFNPALNGQVYPLPVKSVGNPNLKETSVDAFELGYTGIVAHGRAVLSAAVYLNKTTNDILFTEDTTKRYTSANPPPGFPLPPFVVDLAGGFPGQFTYLNFGKTTNKGIELGVTATFNQYFAGFTNYSFQATPKVNFALSEENLPPQNRFNAGVTFNRSRYAAGLNVNYTGSAFWQDVLDTPYHGTTAAYTLVNGSFGLKWAANRVTTSVKGTNLGNSRALEHVFGDLIGRSIAAEIKVTF